MKDDVTTRSRHFPPVRPTPAPTTVPTLLRTALGASLRRRRDEQGLRIVDVAERARLSVAYVSEVERGRKEPSSEVVSALCRALGASLAEVLREVVEALEREAARARLAELRERAGIGAPAAVRVLDLTGRGEARPAGALTARVRTDDRLGGLALAA
ncbi:helix-turn-helix domain-containing protein [Luteimicrobium sp. DT211]|uniref:helix-turn-helix domain-containing protein n=1 Tax=Luteimicrobium sp. DT211 TaxID=3393412 RepID=UPI003CFBA79E